MRSDFVDLRSDTVTRPTAAMRDAMASAEVGDDVFDDDPTVHRLQDRLAEMLGKEAALFVPSGTMSNQIAVRVHCQPGDEVICERACHIYRYEQGGFAQLSGVTAQTVDGQEG
ncbi:MAG: beta-eliminating lyase-related protein, partial [Pirellulales bacterium]|nr:beta-eliminating lyase-related protein [Pirellulales bacterium]